MALKIEFSKRSINELNRIINYLLENWSAKIADEFVNKLYQKLNLLSENPYIYQQTSFRNDVRRCVITKQVSL